MKVTVGADEYDLSEAFVDDLDLSLMSTDMAKFQKEVFASSVKLHDKEISNPSLKVYLALMPSVMKVNGFGGEEGNG